MTTEHPTHHRDFAWPEGKRVVVSLSYDDARPSQLREGLPILDSHRVKATFYVSLANMEGHVDQWRAAAANGHEIGNHSLRHSCSGNFGWKRRTPLEDYDLAQMESELAEADELCLAFRGGRRGLVASGPPMIESVRRD